MPTVLVTGATDCCAELAVFTTRWTIVQSAVMRSHVACLSVCLSVTLLIVIT